MKNYISNKMQESNGSSLSKLIADVNIRRVTMAAQGKYNKMSLTQKNQPQENLEYFVKFPTPNYRNEIDSPESDYIFIYNETNIPIVVLLGWAGCQDRYLMKYSKIYEDRGLITVRYTAPVQNLFWKRSEMKSIGEKILKLIYDMNFDSHPLIFHIFSNGGAYIFEHLLLATRTTEKPIQICGIIFDSAPGERRLLGLYRAVTAIYGHKQKKCNCLASWFITFTLTALWLLEESYFAFKRLFVTGVSIAVNPFHDLKKEIINCPQLFLYSKGDNVIPYKDIEKFTKHREKLGIKVSKVCFEDAEHVKLYIKYPQQYIQCVCKFINACLSSKQISSKYE